MKALRRWLLVVLLPAFAGCPAWSAELNVFAAASLSDALKELAPLYAKASGDTLRFNFGASGALARQIQEEAPADVFLSADELRMDQLQKRRLILADTRRTILANQLVVVVAADGGASLPTLAALGKAEVRRIAIGEPATVPVGAYAKQHLQRIRLWSTLVEKCVPLDNVRAVLAAVEAGNVDAGVVYRTDALISKRVKIALAVSETGAPKITYPVAVVAATKSAESAKAFAAFLAGPEAQAVFAKHGFLRPD